MSQDEFGIRHEARCNIPSAKQLAGITCTIIFLMPRGGPAGEMVGGTTFGGRLGGCGGHRRGVARGTPDQHPYLALRGDKTLEKRGFNERIG
jgi:hypothetical protein